MYKKQIFHTGNKQVEKSWAMQVFSFPVPCDATPLTMPNPTEIKMVPSSWKMNLLLWIIQ